MKICIIGLGYIGLPTAAMFATHGHHVVGVDVNEKVIEALNRGEIIIEEPHLEDTVKNKGHCVPQVSLRKQMRLLFAFQLLLCPIKPPI